VPPIVQYLIYLLVAAAVVVLVRSVQASIREKGEPIPPISPSPPRPLQPSLADGGNHSAGNVLRREPRPQRRQGEARRELAHLPASGRAPESANIPPVRREQSVEEAHIIGAFSRVQPHTGAGALVEGGDNLWDMVVFLRDQVEQLRSERDVQMREIEKLRAALAEVRREEQSLRARRARARQDSAPDPIDGPENLH